MYTLVTAGFLLAAKHVKDQIMHLWSVIPMLPYHGLLSTKKVDTLGYILLFNLKAFPAVTQSQRQGHL